MALHNTDCKISHNSVGVSKGVLVVIDRALVGRASGTPADRDSNTSTKNKAEEQIRNE